MSARIRIAVVVAFLCGAVPVGTQGCFGEVLAPLVPTLPHCDDAGTCPVNYGCVYTGYCFSSGAPASCTCGLFPDWRGCCPDGLVIQWDALTGPPFEQEHGPPACVQTCLSPPCTQCIDADAPFKITVAAVQPCVMDAGETDARACPAGTACFGNRLQRQYCWPLLDSRGCCADGLVVAGGVGGFLCMTPAQLIFQVMPGHCSFDPTACQRCIDGGTP